MTIPTPNEFYIALRMFHLTFPSKPGWDHITVGHADREELTQALLDGHDGRKVERDDYQILLINVDEGTNRDVTEDILAEVFPEEPESDEMPEWLFQEREARIAGHFG